MKYTTLSGSGITVSQCCLGTSGFGAVWDGDAMTTAQEAHELLDAASEQGLTFLDTANIYGQPSGAAEEIIGNWLQEQDRDEIVLATKVGVGPSDDPRRSGYSSRHIRSAVQSSLERLQTDYIDVYYLHTWPGRLCEEALRTLSDLIQEGVVRYVGLCNVSGWQLMKSSWIADVNGLRDATVVQAKLNAVHWQEQTELLEACADQEIAICAYSVLDGGFLTGKYSRSDAPPEDTRATIKPSYGEFSPDEWAVLDEIRAVATAVEATPAQVAIRWVIDYFDATVVPLFGARTVDQLEQNVGASDIHLDSDQLSRIANAGQARSEQY